MIVRRHLHMSEEEAHGAHQIELLCDMGLPEPKLEAIIRTTAAGYEFLESNEANATLSINTSVPPSAGTAPQFISTDDE